MPRPCHYPAILRQRSEVLLLSPSSIYLLLNCYHNLCAVNYTSTMSLYQNNKLHSPRPWLALLGFTLATCIWDWYASGDNLPGTPCVVAERSRTWAGRPHAVSVRPMLIHTYHAATLPWPWEAAFRTAYSWHGRGTAWHAWIKHGRTV
jgi:hypothetical protein